MLPEINEEETRKRIEEFISKKVGKRKAVLGLSGGLDSSVVLKLCEESLGKENVLGVMLQTKYNKEEDLRDAIEYAKELGVEYKVKNIDKIVEEFTREFETDGKLALGNIAARVRMTALYYYSNQYNGMVIGTGNKSEILTGYFTKYGDGGVDIEPIGNLYKTSVRDLARHLKVPERIIEKEPSAGLWEDQTDEKELGMKYETLDKVLYSFENKAYPSDTDSEIIERVKKMVDSNYHKREFPPRGDIVYAEK